VARTWMTEVAQSGGAHALHPQGLRRNEGDRGGATCHSSMLAVSTARWKHATRIHARLGGLVVQMPRRCLLVPADLVLVILRWWLSSVVDLQGSGEILLSSNRAGYDDSCGCHVPP
jgi:hypothetical protein